MKPIKVKIKKLNKDAVIPQYAHGTDAGLDLTAVSRRHDEYGNVVYGFGLAFEIPEGYVGLIFPRSSNYKHNLTLTNSVGVIDSGYRGEVTAKFSYNICVVTSNKLTERIRHLLTGWFSPKDDMSIHLTRFNKNEYKVGDRVAQMIIIPYPKVMFEEVQELSDSERGTNGYGSTGN